MVSRVSTVRFMVNGRGKVSHAQNGKYITYYNAARA